METELGSNIASNPSSDNIEDIIGSDLYSPLFEIKIFTHKYIYHGKL